MAYMDTHAHVFDQDTNFIKTARYTPSYTVTAEDYLATLDKHGFDKGILIQPSFYGTDNSYMLAAIAKYPKRLKGVAVVDTQASKNDMQMLKQQGIIGVRLNLFGLDCPDLSQENWQSFLINLSELDWQLELHAPPSYLVKLLPKLKDYKIAVVIDHFGRIDPIKGVEDPDYLAFISMLSSSQHWIKVSGYYRLAKDDKGIEYAKQSLNLLLHKNMQDRLLWGSDWPNTQFEQSMSFNKALDKFHQIVQDEDLIEKIIIKNNAWMWQN